MIQVSHLSFSYTPKPFIQDMSFSVASLTPAMFCFIAAMVMLEERDDHIDRYLSATALGRNGYYISRIVLPALAALAVTAILLPSIAAAGCWVAVLWVRSCKISR